MFFVVLLGALAVFEIIEGNAVMATAFAALTLAALMPVLEARTAGRIEAGLWGPKLTGARGVVSNIALAAAVVLVGFHAIAR
jgi:hypothetical protein